MTPSFDVNALVAAHARGDDVPLHQALEEGLPASACLSDGTPLLLALFERVPLRAHAFSPSELYDRPAAEALRDHLLQSGFDVDARDAQGRTALLRAIERQQWALADLWFEGGADVKACRSDGCGLLALTAPALSHSRYRLFFWEMMAQWVQRGASVDACDAQGVPWTRALPEHAAIPPAFVAACEAQCLSQSVNAVAPQGQSAPRHRL